MTAKNTKMSWTDDKIATLKKMWKDGKSAADIAKALGRNVTRNAVIGKAHRMGLSGRAGSAKKKDGETKKATTKSKTTAKKTETRTAAKKPKKAETAKATRSTAKSAESRKKTKAIIEEAAAAVMARGDVSENTAGGNISLLDLNERMCRWPIGDPREDDFAFCGLPVRPGTPYCAEHAELAYQTTSRRGASNDSQVDDDDDEDEEDIDADDDEALEVDDDEE